MVLWYAKALSNEAAPALGGEEMKESGRDWKDENTINDLKDYIHSHVCNNIQREYRNGNKRIVNMAKGSTISLFLNICICLYNYKHFEEMEKMVRDQKLILDDV
ncbi:hypothetical protein ACJX0J_012791, partial [Zea mays]